MRTRIKKLIDLLKFSNERGLFHLLVSNGLIQFVSFGSAIIVAMWLTPTQVGEIRIAQSYISVLTIFGSLGFNASVLKLCAEKRSIEHKATIYYYALKLVVINSLIVTCIAIILVNISFFGNNNDLNQILSVYFIIIIPTSIIHVGISFLQALKKIKQFSYIQFFTKVCSIIFLLIGTYILSIHGYIYGVILGQLLTLIFIVYFIERRIINSYKGIKIKILDKSLFKLHWSTAKYSFLGNVLGQLTVNLDIILLNYFISDREQVGFYSLASMLIIAPRMITGTIQQIVTPYLSNKAHNFKDWYKNVKLYNKYFQIISVIILFIALLISKTVIHILFSGKYDNSIIYFNWLIIIWAIRNLFSIYGVASFTIGYQKYNTLISFISLLINFILSVIFIKYYGVIGVIYANVISVSIYYICYLFLIRKIKNNFL